VTVTFFTLFKHFVDILEVTDTIGHQLLFVEFIPSFILSIKFSFLLTKMRNNSII